MDTYRSTHADNMRMHELGYASKHRFVGLLDDVRRIAIYRFEKAAKLLRCVRAHGGRRQRRGKLGCCA
jgi:hypothetical protein